MFTFTTLDNLGGSLSARDYLLKSHFKFPIFLNFFLLSIIVFLSSMNHSSSSPFFSSIASTMTTGTVTQNVLLVGRPIFWSFTLYPISSFSFANIHAVALKCLGKLDFFSIKKLQPEQHEIFFGDPPGVLKTVYSYFYIFPIFLLKTVDISLFLYIFR